MWFKSAKVTVSRYPSTPFRYCESGMLCICNQLARYRSSSAESHNFPWMRPRGDCCTTSWMGGHLLDERKSNRERCWVLVDATVGYDPYEADRN